MEKSGKIIENPNILYEDNHLLVTVKEAGQLAQGDKSGDETLLQTLKDYIKKKYDKPGQVYLGLVHRLDRPVGGLMVFARTSKAANRLSTQFQNSETEKHYIAWVSGDPGDYGVLKHRIGRMGKKAILQKDGQDAHLQFIRLWQGKDRAFVFIKLETGRHHQIRLQFSVEGFPVFGDKLYGSQIKWKRGQIALFACSLSFYHPTTGQKLSFQAMPPNIWKIPVPLEQDFLMEKFQKSN